MRLKPHALAFLISLALVPALATTTGCATSQLARSGEATQQQLYYGALLDIQAALIAQVAVVTNPSTPDRVAFAIDKVVQETVAAVEVVEASRTATGATFDYAAASASLRRLARELEARAARAKAEG